MMAASKSFPFTYATIERMQKREVTMPPVSEFCIRCCARLKEGELIRFWFPAPQLWPKWKEPGHVKCPELKN
jgi:hypothetical protein